jgi:hypothetical protein
MVYKLKGILFFLISALCLTVSCIQKPRLAIAQTKLDVLENEYGRTLVNKDANKKVATIAKGDTFKIIAQRRNDPTTDYFIYYKVKTKTNIKGFLFEKDSFKIIEDNGRRNLLKITFLDYVYHLFESGIIIISDITNPETDIDGDYIWEAYIGTDPNDLTCFYPIAVPLRHNR